MLDQPQTDPAEVMQQPYAESLDLLQQTVGDPVEPVPAIVANDDSAGESVENTAMDMGHIFIGVSAASFPSHTPSGSGPPKLHLFACRGTASICEPPLTPSQNSL